MNDPLISVCIAVSDTTKHLESALRSVGGQTYSKWEILVIEDEPNRRSAAIVQEFALTVTQRVTCLAAEVNYSLPAMRDRGAANAEGEWVAFLAGDDLWKPDHLASLVSASQIEESDAVFAGTILYDNATWTKLGRRTPKESDLAGLPVALYGGRLSILASAVMAKKDSLHKFGAFAKEFPLCCDTEYWLRILFRGGHLCYSGSDTCIYRQMAAPALKEFVGVLAESAKICERYAAWNAIPRSLARTRPAKLYRWAGRTVMKENPTAALWALSHAIRLQPFSAKTLGLWLRIFLKETARSRSGAA